MATTELQIVICLLLQMLHVIANFLLGASSNLNARIILMMLNIIADPRVQRVLSLANNLRILTNFIQ